MPWWRACRPPRGPLDLEQPAACCEGGSVSLAICASSEGILSREAPAQAVIRERPSPPNREETHTFLLFWDQVGHEHFRIEEDILLPALARYSSPTHDAIVRVLTDHVDLRRRAA